MDRLWRETFLLHSKTDSYKQHVEEAETIIKQALKRYSLYVAFSGGKDSTAMLHLVCKQNPDIFVYHHSQGKYMPPPLEREILEVARAAGAKNIHIYPASKNFWTDILPEFSKKFDGVFVGLRKEESVRRRKRIESGCFLTSIKEFWPLQNWTWMDVWAYIVANDVIYHSAYDKYAEVVGWQDARFHSFFDPRLDNLQNIDGVLMWRQRNAL